MFKTAIRCKRTPFRDSVCATYTCELLSITAPVIPRPPGVYVRGQKVPEIPLGVTAKIVFRARRNAQ
jgi:hypothetical protein